jgi:hypothetical protein
VWLRSFPELEEDTEATASALKFSNGGRAKRRAGDKPDDAGIAQTERRGEPARRQAGSNSAQADIQKAPDPRQSYIDFLEQL